MSDVTIKAAESGPYLVSGPATLVDADGNAYEVQSAMIALCRCGASSNKPFCDGTHKSNGFAAEERAG